jgi:hypothetical protein
MTVPKWWLAVPFAFLMIYLFIVTIFPSNSLYYYKTQLTLELLFSLNLSYSDFWHFKNQQLQQLTESGAKYSSLNVLHIITFNESQNINRLYHSHVSNDPYCTQEDGHWKSSHAYHKNCIFCHVTPVNEQ